MLTSAEADRAAVMLTAVEALCQTMRAHGVAQPVAVIRQVLELPSLQDAVEVPLLVWAHENPVTVRWAAPVRALMISFTVDDVFVRRALDRCLDTLTLFGL